MTDGALSKALEQQDAAITSILNGDPGPVIDSWAASDDTTFFGAWGPIEKGHKPVTDTMRWVASRFTGAGTVDVEHAVIAPAGTLPIRSASSAAIAASTAGRRTTRCSALPTSTGALMAIGSSCTGTPTSLRRINEIPPRDDRPARGSHRAPGLRTASVPLRCPRTAIDSQRSPPAATCEHEASPDFEPASNAREHPRNA